MKYFTLKELTYTSTGLLNQPDGDQITNLVALVSNVLDPARERLGLPITVTSGFRSQVVNNKVGGAKNSQHMKGQACDIRCADMNKLWEIMKTLPYDQLINEFNLSWIHVSFSSSRNRHEMLSATKNTKGKTIYNKIKG